MFLLPLMRSRDQDRYLEARRGGCGDADSAKSTHGVERKYNTYLSAGNGAYILNDAF